MIEVQNLSKSFKISKGKSGIMGLFSRGYVIKNAVNDVSFRINKGELVGYVGQNGAGKSTTVKMLCGALCPDSGKIFVNGIEPFNRRKENAYNIGVVFGQRTQLWYDVPVIDSFVLLKKIYGVSNKEYNERFTILNEVLDIKEILDFPVRKLSLGQRMRCEFAAALIHWPSILYLDEPTIGIDSLTRKRIIDFISWLNEECKKTILLTTHNMNDIEKLCRRVILLDDGKKIYDGNTEALKYRSKKHKKIIVNFKKSINFNINNALDEKFIKYLDDIKCDDNKIILTTESEDISLITNIIQILNTHQQIENFEVTLPNLENIIESIYCKENSYEKDNIMC
ncbi:ATP-binding cassette domain-containing protein [Tissierella sp.]|uniref:ABC transporter ATP-binding protein n=1 Tax=Tissierella sp. TaxID=41274 RepID=UPI0030DC8338